MKGTRAISIQHSAIENQDAFNQQSAFNIQQSGAPIARKIERTHTSPVARAANRAFFHENPR
jgi:hypothetical protein